MRETLTGLQFSGRLKQSRRHSVGGYFRRQPRARLAAQQVCNTVRSRQSHKRKTGRRSLQHGIRHPFVPGRKHKQRSACEILRGLFHVSGKAHHSLQSWRATLSPQRNFLRTSTGDEQVRRGEILVHKLESFE
jgi:hypothetical protein